MLRKKEKTDNGTIKGIVPKKKKVSYGQIEDAVYKKKGDAGANNHKSLDDDSDLTPTGETSVKHTGPDNREPEKGQGKSKGQEETNSPANSFEKVEGGSEEEKAESTLEKLEALVKAMEMWKETEEQQKKEQEEQKSGDAGNADNKSEKESEKKEGGSGGESKESESKDQSQQKKTLRENEFLTRLLVTQLKLRALKEIFNCPKVAVEGKQYYSYIAIEGGSGLEVFRTSPAKEGLILDLDFFPYFETEEQARAFLELCNNILSDYCQLTIHLNPMAVIETPDIKVIHG